MSGTTKHERVALARRVSEWKRRTDPTVSLPEEVAGYNRILRRYAYLDFNDLIVETVKLLTARIDILKNLRGRFGAVFVDEYQDIADLQHRFLKVLVGDRMHITAITVFPEHGWRFFIASPKTSRKRRCIS